MNNGINYQPQLVSRIISINGSRGGGAKASRLDYRSVLDQSLKFVPARNVSGSNHPHTIHGLVHLATFGSFLWQM